MIVRNDLQQGSVEWANARIGIPTASHFDKILTPAKLQPSSQAPKYMAHLAAEWILGYPLEFDSGQRFSGWMDRGTNLEDEARAWYEWKYDLNVERIGFILRDDGKVGGSPDGFVGDDGGAEFKVPAMHTHISYLIDPQSLVKEYRAQCNGYMYLGERAWWDIVSYSPKLPPVEVRIERDDKFIWALGNALNDFTEQLDALKERLTEHRYQREAVAV